MSRQDGVLKTTETHGTHQTAKERLMVLMCSEGVSPMSY